MKKLKIYLILWAALCMAPWGLAAAEDDAAKPAAEFSGGVVTVGEARALYDEVAALLGDDAALSGETKQELLEALVEQKIIELKQRELGVYDLGAEKTASLKADAEQQYASMEAEYGADYLAAQGITANWIYDELVSQARTDALRQIVAADVTVTDEEVRAIYDAIAAEQRADFELDPSAYDEALMDGELIVYVPEGYRRVECILVALDDAACAEYDAASQALENTSDAAEIQALLSEIDAIYAAPLETAQKLLARLETGESFSDIQSAYNQDINAAYTVGIGSYQYGDDFREAALALSAIGDISGAVYADNGIYILRYADDLAAGYVPYDTVASDIRSALEGEAENAAYNAAVESWLEQAQIVYYPERI